MSWYKCNGCGHIFEDGEEKRLIDYTCKDQGLFESVGVCPVCGEDFDEVFECRDCGSLFNPDLDLYEGNICKECLLEKINYSTALEYFEKRDILVDFMVCVYFGCDCHFVEITQSMKNEMRDTFNRRKFEDLMMNSSNFIKCVVEYIEEDLDDFARFIYQKEKEAKK